MRSRQIITRRAVDIASLEGLGRLSFGRLADDLDISKAGIQTLFRTKQNLQLSTVETAREVFIDAVIRPAQQAPEGVARLHALLEHWIAYAAQPLFLGGCFWNANLPEFDSHPGPIRDALVHHRRVWLDTLAGQLEHAAAEHPLPATPIDLTVFQLDAALNATNTALRLGESDSVEKLRRVIEVLVPPRG
ncbi:TetR family transcriptional regulator C-terminal domain-containing protein [Nocardia cyriacigeorgica]|uniref:TetR family transcriptional regulator C-terminal domain-containing protein n=1 Tax=Nocardia cyriacigeorgica TaxID=135487 RepID=UPI0024555B61|nr:TetR/AcrR family transcriptional regulator [Nocardia cyriacigeorgica]